LVGVIFDYQLSEGCKMKAEAIVKAFREGGSVQRCHARQMLRPYSVAQHSFNLMGLISQFHPEPSAKLLQAALWHDVPERFTGDIPTPVKVLAPNIRVLLKEVEKRINDALQITHHMDLNDEDSIWLKACDMLELWIWAREERALGNTSCEALEKDVTKIIFKLRADDRFPQELFDYYLVESRELTHTFFHDDAASFLGELS
jgi:hypothetical protein